MPEPRKLDQIQVLRAVTALAVAICHVPLILHLRSQFGTDVFFIISGFIIAYVTQVDAS